MYIHPNDHCTAGGRMKALGAASVSNNRGIIEYRVPPQCRAAKQLLKRLLSIFTFGYAPPGQTAKCNGELQSRE